MMQSEIKDQKKFQDNTTSCAERRGGLQRTAVMFNPNRRLKFGGGGLLLCMVTFTVILFISDFRASYIPQVKRQIQDPGVECRPNCRIPSLGSGRQFYQYFAKFGYRCSEMRWFGADDGRKAVCLDPVLSITPGNCHILSFGINNEWSFDDAFDHFGCKVYSFDPTMGVEDHQRSPNIRFLNVGIGNIKGKRKVGMDKHFDYFEVDRYENILERLNLTNTPIDYLKMDVELSELDFFQDVFRNSPHLIKNIKQIGMELHHGYFGEGIGGKHDKMSDTSPTSTFQLFWQYFHELECYGFTLIHSRKNTPWTEVLWARIPEKNKTSTIKQEMKRT